MGERTRAEQSWIDLALIAEARARARRRRRRIALVIAPLVAVLCGVLIARTFSEYIHPPMPHRYPPSLAPDRTGIVTGHLDACAGLPFGRPVTPGMVTVLRGQESWKPTGHGDFQLVLPKTAVARQYISDNYRQTFRFVLPPGRYVIVGRYKAEAGGLTFNEVTITAGKVVRADLPDLCE